MNRLSKLAAGLLVVAFTIAGCSHETHQLYNQGWVTLIDDGKGLENFNPIGDANWRVEGGALVADKGKGGYLVSKNSYKDFEIYAEFWADRTTNSGIHFRSTDPKKIAADNSYEANIFDMRPGGPSHGTGGIPNFASVSSVVTAGGKWNTYEIHAKGSQITMRFNGVVTVNFQDRSFASGPIALQFGNRGKEPGGAIKWRKVLVRPL